MPLNAVRRVKNPIM